ncbi:unnamed protein product [Vitrella brassicaformis CCMP3155]|uniref:3-hydroxyacyl-[acyl-carrier-protein] dehydratase n=1 Tax=Vitrella brassicaformis (strain CCMP3155) TaxID=1169540 RepID=A0A0G4H2S5_VITBC|nr:unnamed protein product [Vitrella brassicaformis CCMP3155]|eukprot:CEM37968.1 unnamed protein product [Vitrella brassicaformis CCMP3155]
MQIPLIPFISVIFAAALHLSGAFLQPSTHASLFQRRQQLTSRTSRWSTATETADTAETAAAEAPWRSAASVSELTSDVPVVMDIEAIRKVLPHRYPFLLVDKVIEFEPGKRAVGVKTISANEPQFTGHFPERAIMPGVLQIEAMAQLGGLVCLQEPLSDGKGDFFFAGVDGVRWKRPVVPGDVLVMEMELLSWRAKFGIAKMTGAGYVDGQKAVEVKEFTFALAK